MVLCLSHSPAQSQLHYRPRKPEQSVLYKIFEKHLDRFISEKENNTDSSKLPSFVKDELQNFLSCGVLSKGLVRLRCSNCGFEFVIGFSCKGRICPSCCGKRMTATSAHLVEHVFPEVAVRQYVLTLPIHIRYLISYKTQVLNRIMNVFLKTICQHLRCKLHLSKSSSHGGAVTVIQRSGSALNTNPHFHALVLDGLYQKEDEKLTWQSAPELTDEEVDSLLHNIRRRILRVLQNAGIIDEDSYLIADPFNEDETVLGSITRTAMATPTSGQLFCLQQQETAQQKNHLCTAEDGFSLHAATWIPAHDRKKLENLCRYITRPPVAAERIEVLPNGFISYRLKNAYSNGATHVIYDPIKFIEKLAALIPPPKSHLIHFHGILAPHSKLRSQIVPNPPANADEENINEGKADRKKCTSTWAKLIKHVFLDDPLACPRCCSSPMKIVAFITEKVAIQGILKSLDLADNMASGP